MTMKTEQSHRDPFGAKLGMWLFLATEVILFGGLFLAYGYLRGRYAQDFHRGGATMAASLGIANTILLLTSSLTVALAGNALRRSARGRAVAFLAVTLGLGLAFLVVKSFEWRAKFQHGLFPKAKHLATLPEGERAFFGLYFTMTGLHGLHVLVGLVVMLVLLTLTARRSLGPAWTTPLENGSLYWHLVDIIWILLLPLFYLSV